MGHSVLCLCWGIFSLPGCQALSFYQSSLVLSSRFHAHALQRSAKPCQVYYTELVSAAPADLDIHSGGSLAILKYGLLKSIRVGVALTCHTLLHKLLWHLEPCTPSNICKECLQTFSLHSTCSTRDYPTGGLSSVCQNRRQCCRYGPMVYEAAEACLALKLPCSSWF